MAAPVVSPVAAPVALPVAAPMAASPVMVPVAASPVAAAPEAPAPGFGFLNYLNDRPQTPVYQPWQYPPSPVLPPQSPNLPPVAPGHPLEVDRYFDAREVVIPHYFINDEHRRLDLLWMTRDNNVPCYFHPEACGTFVLSCGSCGPLVICFCCKTHFIRSMRQDCPACNRNPLQRELFIPLY